MHPKQTYNLVPSISIILLTLISSHSFSQSVEKKHTLSISVPVFYNSTTITNVFGPTRQISGSRLSFALRASYEHSLTKQFYLKAGVGMFIQSFGSERPFEDFEFVSLLMSTKKYSYSTVEFSAGGGYRKKINAKNELDLGLTYHMLYSFRQKYVPRNDYYAPTITNNKYVFAHMINPSININRKLNSAFSFQYGITIPVLTRWRKDRRFDENPAEFNKPTFHIGATIGVKYHF